VDAFQVIRFHEPLLPNVVGHTAGTVIFAIFLALLLRDPSNRGMASRRLSLLAATTALVWNAGSLWLLTFPPEARIAGWLLTAVSTAALSLLPAFLLDLSLDGNKRRIAYLGYGLSLVAVGLHFSEPVVGGTALHRNTLVLTAGGFALLVFFGSLLPWRGVSRSAGAMALFLFALSFSHFSQEEAHAGWLIEVFVHHAGLPLALFVLMQDYRFVLLDAFLRFLANILLAAVFAWAGLRAAAWAGWFEWRGADPRAVSIALISSAAALVLFAMTRQRLQSLLTRLLFRPRRAEDLLARLRECAAADETSYLQWAAEEIARFFDAKPVEHGAAEAEITVPIRLSDGGNHSFGLTRRAGGRRFLSEDHEVLSAFAAEISARIERFREDELRRLAADAELRALQSQIHPHFLFNALNTLYGIIPREAKGARETVLNLSELLRYFLRTGTQTIPLEEEMRIIRAYLAIETLRLGEKLDVEMDLDPAVLQVRIPVLSIQPLVENAIKHGIAPNPQGGRLCLAARRQGGWLDVRVGNSAADSAVNSDTGAGIGLENVRRRLRLCYGDGATLAVEHAGGATVATLRVPLEVAK
jgi:hypothetical protein